jgi:hypothetical protein
MKAKPTGENSILEIRMKPFFPLALIAILIALTLHAQTPSTAADGNALLSVDHAFTEAVERGDKAEAGKFLDKEFEFTNPEGMTFTGAQIIDRLPAIITAAQAPTDVHSYDYGQVGDVSGINQKTRFLRVWVRRNGDWRIFNYIETPIGPHVSLAPGGGDCNNPCRSVPYTPKTEMDKKILEAWQHAKNDEWHPNSKDWALRVADEFSIINSGTDRSKQERVAMLAKQQAAGESGPPGDPIHSIRMFDFGDSAAVMLSIHTPYRGGKQYYNVRVWILRDGLWQLAASQQTTMQTAAVAAPAGG